MAPSCPSRGLLLRQGRDDGLDDELDDELDESDSSNCSTGFKLRVLIVAILDLIFNIVYFLHFCIFKTLV
jgi:hypothetical protein